MKRKLLFMLATLAASALLFNACKDKEELKPDESNVVATVSANDLITAVADMYAAWEESTTIANSLTVAGKELTLPQYQYAMCKLIDNLSKSDKSYIKVLNYKPADHPERDSYDRDEIAVYNGPANKEFTEDLGSIAVRMMDSMKEKSTVPNVTIFYRDDAISFSTNRATVCFARAIAAYKADGKMPEKVATEYLSAGSTLMGFAKEFVKILDVWQAHVGQIEADGAHSVDSKKPWVDVHYIPTQTTTFPNSAENSEAETVIEVAGQTYNMEQCWTIAAQGIINMITEEGTALTPTVQNVREHTIGDGKGLDQAIPTPPEMIPWQHPFYEYAGLLNLSSKNPWKTEHFAAVLPWWYLKSTLSNGRVTNFASIGSFGIEGYTGELSAMRMLLMMARYYKYLLDNKITKNVYTATKGLIIDHDLYGIKLADVELQTSNEISFEATPAGAVNIKFAANTAWTATASEAWIHVDPASGDIENPATVSVTVDTNTGAERSGTVTIKGSTDEVAVTVTQLAYVAPSGATLKDVATEFVKVLNVWKANVGTIQPDGQHQGDKRFFDVHYIPTWSNYGAEVTDNVSKPETTITVGEETYTMYEAWVVAAKGIVEILTKEGMECVPDAQDVLKHTLGQGKGLDIAVPAKNASWNKWAYPWYEDGDLNLSAEKPFTVEMLAQMAPWWLKRAQTLDSGKGRINNFQQLGDYKFAGGQSGMMSAMRMFLIMARFYKHLLDNNIESNVYEAVHGMTIDHDLYGIGIPAEGGANMKTFATQFVTFLDVWQSHVGTIEADGNHSTGKGTEWKNVHYIPTYSDYADSDNNKEPEATITVGDKTYKVFEAWDIAIKGFVEMVTLEGTSVWPTALNSPVHTLGNGKSLTMDIPELEADKWNKCKYPWYQNEGAANFDADHPVNMEVLRRVLPFWLNRARQLDSGTGRFGNYQDMGASGLEGYKGLMCPMQSLLILCRFYKYLLDNNIESNVYDAVKDQTFDPTLY
ncbi:MAG: BACON domain-containing protein [Bacteroidales bacterium]|nr:BACON domain-containing protein [Bacteroidales bacterium]